MEAVDRSEDGDLDLVITVTDVEASVADLIEALGHGEAQALGIDGRRVSAESPLSHSGLVRGSIVGDDDRQVAALIVNASAALELCVIGGLDAGHAYALTDGTHTVGRAPECDVRLRDATVSRRHLSVRVSGASASIADAGSAAGTLVDGVAVDDLGEVRVSPSSVVTIGSVQLVIRPPRLSDRSTSVDPIRYATSQGEIPFNRPPRQADPEPSTPLTAPKAPPAAQRSPLNIAGVIAPIVIAGVMAVAFHNALFALISLMSPVIVVVTWDTGRRHAGKAAGAAGRAFRAEMAVFTEQAERLVTAERARRHQLAPDIAELIRRVALPSTKLWERRPAHGDFLSLTVGTGTVPWQLPVAVNDLNALDPEVAEVMRDHSALESVPLSATVAADGAVGIVGARDETLPVARSLLLQAALLHGPSDVHIAVLADADRAGDWEFAKWLPHVRDLMAGDARRLFTGVEECSSYIREVMREASSRERISGGSGGPTLLLVVDAPALSLRRDPQFREVLRGKRVRATGIVLVETADALPEVCSTVVTISEFRGTARYSKPQIGVAVEEMIVTGVSEGTARHVARQLARYDDPEVGVAGSDIPRHVAIGGLLGLASFDSGAVIERWATYDRQVKELAYRDPLAKPSLATRLGRSEDGVVTLDIVNDGPHGLVGGTSGSGKTELLRGFVLGLALEASPTYLNFFFIDYKGAAGFGALSRLPHTVGMATNLSPALTERALAALKSELDYRLRKFRSAPGKVEELHQYWMATDDPLPRLVVVIDELAELKDALPEFITTLVRIGRIGRTLGIHLVTATQRPGEVVKGDLRENTNFSIALRVNEPANSVDLIGVPDASTIPPRGYQGRAYLRIGGTLGPPPVLFQSALSSGRSTGTVVRPVSIAPFRYGTSVEARSDAAQPSSGTAEQSAAETDLERLVAAAIEAFGGAARPRSPWTDPLPELLALDEVLGLDEPELTDWVVPFAIADDVANQSRRVAGWDTKAGNLLVYGILGSGTTTTLKSVAVSLLTRFGPARSHVYVIDAGAGELRELERVPGVGAVVTPSETERQVRLVGYLLSEIQRRRESPRPGAPLLVLVVDNFGRLAAGDTAADVIDGISRIFTEGPDVGVLTAASADRGGAISMRLADLAPQKWVLRLADKGDYTGFGLPRRDPADLPPGRAVVATSGLVAQIAVPDLAAIAERLGKIALERDEAPRKIEVLADSVTLSELVPYLELGTERWFIPVGRGHERLDVVGWTLAGGDHAMVIGPPRSGKSSFLAALASVIRLGRPDCFVGALTPRPTSPLATSGVCDLATADVEELWTALAAITNAGTPRLVLIDDAHLLGDESGRIEAIVRETGSATHIVAAARTDDLRQLFGHWSQAVRRGRNGLVLRVSQAIDGDPINARLPMQRTYDSRPGRGYISCDGDTELVQVPLHASPDA